MRSAHVPFCLSLRHFVIRCTCAFETRSIEDNNNKMAEPLPDGEQLQENLPSEGESEEEEQATGGKHHASCVKYKDETRGR